MKNRKSYLAAWWAENKEAVNAKKRAEYRAKAESECARSAERRSTLRGRYSILKGSAKQRNIELTITFEEYSEIVKNPCFYCKGKLGSLSERGHSIDRARNDLGYIPFNCLPCCIVCNMLKSSHFTSKETLAAVDAILKHREYFNNLT